jgi:23S rRNA pseudouridine1911/1915/1917 synthase
MTVLFEHIVPSGVENERFLEYVIENIPTVLSRNSAKKAIKKGALLLDDGIVESGRYVHSGQAITHIQHNETSGKIFEKKLEVVFEDEYIAVINKPAGISVSGNYFRTIQNALPFNLNPSNKSDAILPKPVHRIDNQTSGLLIIAKTQQAAINLGQQFVNKSVSKTYIVISLTYANNWPYSSIAYSYVENGASDFRR